MEEKVEETVTQSAPVAEQPASTPVEAPTSCHVCEKPFKHAQVVVIGTSSEDKQVGVHRLCTKREDAKLKIKNLFQVHIHLEKDKRVSPAQSLIIKKHLKEIFNVAAKSRAARELAERGEA